MKKNNLILLSLLALATALFPLTSKAQEAKLIADASTSKQRFINTDPAMAALFTSSVGYAIFPNIGKGAIGIGGAAGNGVVYQGSKKCWRMKPAILSTSNPVCHMKYLI